MFLLLQFLLLWCQILQSMEQKLEQEVTTVVVLIDVELGKEVVVQIG
jgi:hypothetical protein